MTTTTATEAAALIAIAESLWSALKQMNADDVHGRRELAVQVDDMAYGQVHNALLATLLPLVDDDKDRAARVRDLLSDNYESVAYNLTYEAEETRRNAELARIAAIEDDPRTGDELTVEDLHAGMTILMVTAKETFTGTLRRDDYDWLQLGGGGSSWLLQHPSGHPTGVARKARFYAWDADRLAATA